MGAEFIPAVIEGETHDEARRRVRSIFVHVNKTAQPPTKGEIAILDEDYGFAVAAKTIAFSNPLFKKDEAGDRINWKTNALPSGSKWLTSSVTLIEMVADYLSGIPEYAEWKPDSSKEIPFRPEKEEIDEGVKDATEFFDHLMKLPVFENVRSGTPIDEIREFPPEGAGHLLLRPIGQQILAAAVGYMHNNISGPKTSLDDLFKKLADYDDKGGFSHVSDVSSIWYGVTYNPHRGTMATDRKAQAVLLLRHMLHDDLTKDERTYLLEQLEDARATIYKRADMVLDWDGSLIDPGTLKLPIQI
jgi:hypothetical protein